MLRKATTALTTAALVLVAPAPASGHAPDVVNAGFETGSTAGWHEGAGWDPEDPASGDGWENQALFDYDYRALPAISVFGRR